MIGGSLAAPFFMSVPAVTLFECRELTNNTMILLREDRLNGDGPICGPTGG